MKWIKCKNGRLINLDNVIGIQVSEKRVENLITFDWRETIIEGTKEECEASMAKIEKELEKRDLILKIEK